MRIRLGLMMMTRTMMTTKMTRMMMTRMMKMTRMMMMTMMSHHKNLSKNQTMTLQGKKHLNNNNNRSRAELPVSLREDSKKAVAILLANLRVGKEDSNKSKVEHLEANRNLKAAASTPEISRKLLNSISNTIKVVKNFLPKVETKVATNAQEIRKICLLDCEVLS